MRGRGTCCRRSEPQRSPAAASLRLGPLKVPGFALGATHGTTGTGLSAWPQRDAGEERGVVARCGGLCSGRDRAPSPLCPCLGLCRCLAGVPPRPCRHPEARAATRAGLCQGPWLRWERPGKVDSSDLNHAGRLPVRRHRLSHLCRHQAGHGGLLQPARLGGTGAGRGPHTAPGCDLIASPSPRAARTPGPASPQRWSGARATLAKRGAVPVPVPPTCPPQAGRGETPGEAMPGPHGTASPRVGTGGGRRAGRGSPRCCGEQVCGRAPRPSKASGTPAWPVPGVSAGAMLAGRDSTGVTPRPGAPWPHQPCYQPPDGCCRAMATSQPRAGRGGPPFISGDGHSALGLSSPWFVFFFFTPQWKTIFERLHHAGVSGAAGGERG